MELWTVKSTLEWTTGYLERKGDEHPRLSAEWLLCAATGLSRVEVYTNYLKPLNSEELATLREGVKRRGRGEPLQYVTGEMPFRHIVLKCGPGVLIPRPETEVLVDCVLGYLDANFPAPPALEGAPAAEAVPAADAPPAVDAAPAADVPPDPGVAPDPGVPQALVLEVGAGTGCIALSLADERSYVRVRATDVSPEAFALATRNRDALSLGDRVELFLTDMASGVEGADDASFDVLVSNPPYIPSDVVDRLPAEVGSFEPRLALDGGPDGLDVFRRVVGCAVRALKPGGLLACELFEERLEAAAREPLVTSNFTDVRVVKDLTGRDRVLLAVRTNP